MRMPRYASILPLLFVMAGCTASTGDTSDAKAGGSIFVAVDEQAKDVAGDLALQHISERPELVLGAGEMAVERVVIDANGEAHARIGQMIGGIPVFEGEAVVHIGADGMFNSMTDKLIHNIDRDLDLTPAIQQKDALETAVLDNGGKDMLLGEPKVDMQILRRDGVDHLTYRVQLEMRTIDEEPSMPVVFVDAHSGDIVWQYDNLETARNRKTYTSKNRQTLPGTLLRSEGQGPVSDAVANLAHDNAGYVYDYYMSRHNHDSFDGNGGTIISSVHYSRNYVNAFWNGTQMVYGDGDGTNASPLVVLDVVGHEITHAVTERSSNLTYSNESGALNESMSDIFGAAIEAYRDGGVSAATFQVGEECWTPNTPGDALRQMDDPALYGDYDWWPTRYTGTSDNGGVHWNSGISNLAFSLMVKGGTHPRGKSSTNVPALSSNLNTSIQMAANIFYAANTACMTAGSTFKDAFGCTRDKAQAIYGANAAASVTAAWTAVGVPAPLDYTVIDTQSNLSAGKNGQITFSYTLGSGAAGFKAEISGPNGDADLYVKKGSAPTTASYDCRSASASSNEGCTLESGPGTYYVMINAYSAYTGLSYTASSGQ